MVLSSANALQAKTGFSDTATGAVSLDAGTTAGSTVTVELHAAGVPFTDGGLFGRVPAGFETDGGAIISTSTFPYFYYFRKRDVAAGEGVAGSTSWDFSYVSATGWNWRVTEWDAELEPVSPLEVPVVYTSATGTSPTTVSTGTTNPTNRSGVVCLAWHHWHRATATAQSMTFSGHTNGFTIRDSLRRAFGTTEFAECWSWAFGNTAGATYETTATINLTTRNSQDVYLASMVVYAATTYA